VDVKDMYDIVGFVHNGSGQGTVSCCYEHANGPVVSINGRDIMAQLGDYSNVKKVSASHR
jgi:hypothetical protein